jgi:pyrimidine-nucleoside phosphorylase
MPTSARIEAPPTITGVITKKRHGAALTQPEIAWLVDAYTHERASDAQLAAFAMAVCLRGMDAGETAALTLAMRDSGRRARLRRDRRRPKLDKHSTGGVGDKVSICLAPLLAACGARVPMISGRSLGHTGGTLDKLEAIPGFSVELPLRRFERQVDREGLALIGQTHDLAPADRKLYALRDATATVDSVPLITASILSKKLSEDLDALVMDIKVGRGAFMKTLRDARELARSIVNVGALAGLEVRALLTRMDAPLGRAVGNALETAEAFELLHGRAPDDLRECTFALGSELLCASKLARSDAEARDKLERAVRGGSALAFMERVIEVQGGDRRVVREPDRLPRARRRLQLTAAKAGWVQALDALAVGELAMRLGAGRTQIGERVDPSVGVYLHKKPGERVARGELLAELHVRGAAGAAELTQLMAAYRIGPHRPRIPALVIERIAR